MSNSKKSWYLVDAQGQTLGRLATRIAIILRGKNQTTYLPSIDTGNYVIVINASKISLSGNKTKQKTYYYHSSKPGHLQLRSFMEVQNSSPETIIKIAVKGMLPKNFLAKQQLKKLKVYDNIHHPHLAQQPKLLHM